MVLFEVDELGFGWAGMEDVDRFERSRKHNNGLLVFRYQSPLINK
jgi:hypothetical protein